MSARRFPWAGFPTGWFALARSAELPPGAVLARRRFGRELVLFRGENGTAGVLEAHCPHLGAHLGQGGRVDRGALRCPMHGFRFDAAGACLSTPYADGRVPPGARAGALHAREWNGAVLAWHDGLGRPPLWELPELEPADFAPAWERSFRLRTQPQETTENAVDLGHLGEVHAYREVEVRQPLRTEGPLLSVAYGVSRRTPFGLGPDVRAEFEIRAFGLGVSCVDVRVLGTGLRTRHLVLATPVDEHGCELLTSMRVERGLRPSRVHWALGLLPRPLAFHVVSRLAFASFLGDLRQDFRIWEHKLCLDPPALAPGDGPVGRYRQWTRQFYPAAPGAGAVSNEGLRPAPAPDERRAS